MNRDRHNTENVYECQGHDGQPCGSLYDDSTISYRPGTNTLYCRTCQSERLRLLMEEMAVEHGLRQGNEQRITR